MGYEQVPPSSPSRLRLLALVALVALALTACRYDEVDGVGSRTADEEFPPQLDVEFTGCSVGALSQWHATATVVNPTDVPVTYELTVGFYDGDVRLAQRSHWIRELRPSETAEVDAGWWVESAERVTDCRLLTVNRFG